MLGNALLKVSTLVQLASVEHGNLADGICAPHLPSVLHRSSKTVAATDDKGIFGVHSIHVPLRMILPFHLFQDVHLQTCTLISCL